MWKKPAGSHWVNIYLPAFFLVRKFPDWGMGGSSFNRLWNTNYSYQECRLMIKNIRKSNKPTQSEQQTQQQPISVKELMLMQRNQETRFKQNLHLGLKKDMNAFSTQKSSVIHRLLLRSLCFSSLFNELMSSSERVWRVHLLHSALFVSSLYKGTLLDTKQQQCGGKGGRKQCLTVNVNVFFFLNTCLQTSKA